MKSLPSRAKHHLPPVVASVYPVYMLPKFCNPHGLKLPGKKVTRAELCSSDDAVDMLPDDTLTALQETLKRRITESLGQGVDSLACSSGRKRKKRKVAQDFFLDDEGSGIANSVLFRLFSMSSPSLVCLDPLPPPQSQFREPDCEDLADAADERRSRALSVAVDAEWVMKCSRLQYLDPPSSGYVEKASLSPLDQPPPRLVLLQRQQAPRSTRPPVSGAIRRYPYARDAIPDNSPSLALVPVATLSKCNEEAIKKKRKRIRGKARNSERLQPRYWAPDMGLRGKCKGYAFGYPSSFNVHEEARHNLRDSMKRAVFQPIVDTHNV